MNLMLLAPEILLSVVALCLFVAETLWPNRRLLLNIASFSLLAAAALIVQDLGRSGTLFGMAAVDDLSQFFKLVLLAGVLLVVWMSDSFHGFGTIKTWGTYLGVLLLATVGMMLLVSSSDFLMVVISIELLGISSFILTGYFKDERRSSEAAIKFFLIGAFSSALMIYGISLLYGLTGSTALSAVSEALVKGSHKLPLIGAIVLILAGFGFKLAMAPFHMWVPDTYEGAPTPVTAFLSVAPKAAALGIIVRAFPNHQELGITWLLALLAAVTMSVGNLSALRQTNIKRLLGYSSIAQMGYVLVGFVAAGSLGMESVLIYALAYLFMNLGAFACVIAVANESQTEELDGFSGLGERSLPLALVTTIFLLSLTGIPPLIGFVGKFAIFAAAMKEQWVWLAVIGVVNSVVSLYYYFGIVHRMFFNAPSASATGKFSMSPSLVSCVVVTLFITVVAGIFPNALLAWVQRIVQ